MATDFSQMVAVSGAGMKAQSARMRVAAENLANIDSVQSGSGSGPYRARQVYFKAVMDKATGAAGVQADIRADTKTPLRAEYNPGSDMANKQGFVMMPNVDMTTENLNMKEAQRSYEANMAAVAAAREMASRTLDMLK
jgi:flagellar basal-body rod protein FlgC